MNRIKYYKNLHSMILKKNLYGRRINIGRNSLIELYEISFYKKNINKVYFSFIVDESYYLNIQDAFKIKNITNNITLKMKNYKQII